MIKKSFMWVIILIILLFIFWFLKFAKHYPRHIDLAAKPDYWGVTYSSKFAKSLGLDWQVVYLAILDDLQIKNIRLPIYWDEIETSSGTFDFSDYDYMFSEGQSRNVEFIANIGWRLPRWPECHTPAWLSNANTVQIKEQTLVMLEMVVNRYKNNPNIVAWQVENEPLLDSFGECPPGDRDFLQKEVALVKKLDSNRPIIISGSGELSWWKEEAKMGDIFGTTMYRVVWNQWVGYFRYAWPAWYYQLKGKWAGLTQNRTIISELQAEPWVPHGSLTDLPLAEANKSFDINQFRANLQFAINVDFKQAYLWGVEWWYWEKIQLRPQYWDLAKKIFGK